MPAAGRPDSKYVRRVHYAPSVGIGGLRITTRCGKRVLQRYATRHFADVTCRTCLLILDIPPGDLDGGAGDDDAEDFLTLVLRPKRS